MAKVKFILADESKESIIQLDCQVEMGNMMFIFFKSLGNDIFNSHFS